MSDVREIMRTEISESFIDKMRSRMVMSYYKYGPIINAYPKRVDAIASLMQRLSRYEKTGNTEYLVDAANYAMIEFMYPRHAKAHFRGTDDEDPTGRINVAGEIDHRPNSEVGRRHVSEVQKFRE